MEGRGYYAWGPITSTEAWSVRVQIATDGNDVDVFVFNQENYEFYVEDEYRQPPFNYGYVPVRSQLNVDNSDMTAALLANENYYIVIDHTEIGAANGNGDGTYNAFSFQYKITNAATGANIDLPTPLNTNSASSILPSFLFSAILAVLAVAFRQ
jgi:hypothetical protein